MLKLENVSKFYSSNGVVTAGFSKVNLTLDRGEFVAITGESGSGKSTLLNVISGIDSYEEGEIYLEGQPTSGYSSEDTEEYRKKYIGNIFQTFNLIGSYTVYQNIELVLLLSGSTKSEAKPIVEDLIKRVGLEKYRNSKASRLSGGQKQRVAIARALAKETPIIVADEPTGNLDVESAKGIIQLLYEISAEKLVIIVTHNYEQVEQYVTRKITMNDGHVIDDKVLKPNRLSAIESDSQDQTQTAESATAQGFTQYKKEKGASSLTALSTLNLGVRNAFNIPSKTLLLLFIFLFMCVSTFASYNTYKKLDDVANLSINSESFANTSFRRIIVNKSDDSLITAGDLAKLKSIPHVEAVVDRDVLTDMQFQLLSNDSSDATPLASNIYTMPVDIIKNLKISEGTVPKGPNEILLLIDKDSQYDINTAKDFVGKDIYLGLHNSIGTDTLKLKVSGYALMDSSKPENKGFLSVWNTVAILANEPTLDNIQKLGMRYYIPQFTWKANIGKYAYATNVQVLDKLPEGKAYITENLSQHFNNGIAKGKEFSLHVNSSYAPSTRSADLKVDQVITKDNVKKLLGKEDLAELNSSLFISPADFNKLTEIGQYQASVYITNVQFLTETIDALQKDGFRTLSMAKVLASGNSIITFVLHTFRLFMMAAFLIALFYISYFIIRLVLKSRNGYYVIVRMLGGSRKNCVNLMVIELVVLESLAFLATTAAIVLTKQGILNLGSFVNSLAMYVSSLDYVIICLILLAITFTIAKRYSRKMFAQSSLSAFHEEV